MRAILAGVCILAATASPCRADGLSLTIQNGKVSIDAQGVTLRQILSEWARVGKTRIMNIEKVTSAPMTLKLDNVSEETALDILLRALPGYMAAPRTTFVADSSLYDRILILATTTPVAAARPQPAAFQGTQLRAAPVPNPAMVPGISPDPEAEEQEDRNLAAAAAVGLVPPGTTAVPGSSNFPTGPGSTPFAPVTPATASPAAPPASPPSNPWNAPPTRSVFEPTPLPSAPAPLVPPVQPSTLSPPDR